MGGNSLSDLLVFGKRAGEHAAEFAKQNEWLNFHEDQIEGAARTALEPFERNGGEDANNPYRIQHDLQEMMQQRVGIVRFEADMAGALDGIHRLHEKASQVHVVGNREYNPGWHTALDLRHLLTVAEAITRAALERRESRGAHFREDFPAKDEGLAKTRMVIRKGDDGAMRIERTAVPELPAGLKQIIEEMK